MEEPYDYDAEALQGAILFATTTIVRLLCTVLTGVCCPGERSNLLPSGNNAGTKSYAELTRAKGQFGVLCIDVTVCSLLVLTTCVELAWLADVVQQGRALEGASGSGIHQSDSNAIAAALHIPAHPQGGQYGTAVR